MQRCALNVLATLAIIVWPVTASALLTIEITKGVETGVPIAVVPFGWDTKKGALPHDIAVIVDADLLRSGRFLTLPKKISCPPRTRIAT